VAAAVARRALVQAPTMGGPALVRRLARDGGGGR
jgi:hypothetical protein